MEKINDNNIKDKMRDRSQYVVIPGEVEYYGVRRHCLQILIPDDLYNDGATDIKKMMKCLREIVDASELQI